MNPNAFYLARDGKNTGPFTSDQIESMRGSGELSGFQWMWDPSIGNWMPLGAPPAPPSTASTASTAETPSARKSPSKEKQERRAKADRVIEAVCHDNHALVSGTLDAMTESGCELLVESAEAGQVFSKRVPVRLNLLDPKTGESTDISARLEGVSRKDGRWAYRLRWDSLPDLLAS